MPDMPQPSAKELEIIFKEMNKPILFSQVKRPTTVEEGPNDVVFFRDADHHIYMSMPKEVYLDLLEMKKE